MTNNSQDPRRVLNQAATLWRNSYKFLTTLGAEPNNRLGGNSPNQITISAALLSDLYNNRPHDSDVISFWLGLDPQASQPTPLIIASSSNGVTTSGQAIHNNQLVPFSDTYITDATAAWTDFCGEKTNDGDPANDYVPVRFYWYTWIEMLNLIGHDFVASQIQFHKDISIEMIAHTVEPENKYFDVESKDDNHTLEGYIALDLMLSVDGQFISPGYAYHYNFMMPCPKFCPELPIS